MDFKNLKKNIPKPKVFCQMFMISRKKKTLGYGSKNLYKIHSHAYGLLFFVISISGDLGGGTIRYDGRENGEKEEECLAKRKTLRSRGVKVANPAKPKVKTYRGALPFSHRNQMSLVQCFTT
jgi:hypothetical protein